MLLELVMEFGGKNGRWRGLAYAFEADKGAPSTAQVGSRRRSNIASPKPELLWDVKDKSSQRLALLRRPFSFSSSRIDSRNETLDARGFI